MNGIKDRQTETSLAALWRTCFGDSEEYISRFIREVDCTALYETAQGGAVSMLFLVDASLRVGGKSYGAPYVYAACTRPDMRSRGLMASLLERAAVLAADSGAEFLSLCPSQASLFDYYARLGFVPALGHKRLTLGRRALEASAGEYRERRERCALPDLDTLTRLRGEALGDALLWSASFLFFALRDNELSGGETVCIPSLGGEADGFAAVSRRTDLEGRVTEVHELVSRSPFGAAAAVLLNSDDSERYIFNLPTSYPLTADSLDAYETGMLKPLGDGARRVIENLRGAYMGLPVM